MAATNSPSKRLHHKKQAVNDMQDEFLWVEKYRPKIIDDVILPPKLKNSFQKIVTSGNIPNMLLSGTAGLGKTTVAKALCNQLGVDYMFVNGSDEGNIDTLRNKIKSFVTTVSLSGGKKAVILDEADYLNPSSFQPALRGFMEEFSSHCSFILTCNLKNRIIAPLHSRCSVYDFNFVGSEKSKLAGLFMNRVETILKTEGIEYEKKAVADVILQHAPDWRRILNELQRTATDGEITIHNIVTTPTKFNQLFAALKGKDFKAMRSWVVQNIDSESSAIFRGIYDEMGGKVKTTSIPSLILILAEYQYKSAFVADHELNMVACMVEIMSNVDFL